MTQRTDPSPYLAAATVLLQIGYPLTSGDVRTALTVATVVVFFLASTSHALVHRGARWTAGYVLVIRQPDQYQHRCLKGPDTNVNLHVYSPGCPEIGRYLTFRDRLRGHPGDRAYYQQVKRELAERDWTYVQEYADAKTEVVGEIIARARAAGGRG